MVGTLIGRPEEVDPSRFRLRPVAGQVLEADERGIEDHFLLVSMRSQGVGRAKATSVVVTFEYRGESHVRRYPYSLVLEVTNGSGRDPRELIPPS